MPKAWLQDRWSMLLPALEEAEGVEEEIVRICLEEIEAWKARPTMKSPSSLKKPMTDTRNRIREIPLTDANSYFNERAGEREHLALKYLNYVEEEWAAMNARSDEKLQQRLEDRKLIDYPERVVEKAAELLRSKHWYDIVLGLAVTTGRRLTEVLKVGTYKPKTRYTVVFEGQLKRKDEVLEPYEIPTLVEDDRVLSAWKRLRELMDCSTLEKEHISVKYGPLVVDAAQRHFADLVPARSDGDLYTHLFRAVYGRIACHYYARPQTSDFKYMATIYGHYWVIKATGKTLENYASTLHYSDYLIGDGKGNIDGRQGIRLGEPGVVLLEKFQPKPEVEHGVPEKEVELLTTQRKKDHSATRMEPGTKVRLDNLQRELNYRTQDEALNRAMDDHYLLNQMVEMLKPLYEQFEVDNPVGAVRELVGNGAVIQVDQQLQARFKTNFAEIVGLLAVAATDSGEKTSVDYLRDLLMAKREFKKSYEKRHAGKDYSKMTTSELRNTKMPGAAQERFRRAVKAIMAYNDQVDLPEMRWYISPAVVVDLVGGRPSDVKEYLASREDIEAHHQKYGLRPGYNRRSINIRERITVPEQLESIVASDSEASAAEA